MGDQGGGGDFDGFMGVWGFYEVFDGFVRFLWKTCGIGKIGGGGKGGVWVGGMK